LPFPTQENIELPLLKVIEESGGQLSLDEAVKKVTDIFDRLTEEDKTRRLATGRKRWSNRVQWARYRLLRKGELDGSVWGVWKITAKGRARLLAEWSLWKPRYLEVRPREIEYHQLKVSR